MSVDFLVGVGVAVLLLAIIAVTMVKTRWGRKVENPLESGPRLPKRRVSGGEDD